MTAFDSSRKVSHLVIYVGNKYVVGTFDSRKNWTSFSKLEIVKFGFSLNMILITQTWLHTYIDN